MVKNYILRVMTWKEGKGVEKLYPLKVVAYKASINIQDI